MTAPELHDVDGQGLYVDAAADRILGAAVLAHGAAVDAVRRIHARHSAAFDRACKSTDPRANNALDHFAGALYALEQVLRMLGAPVEGPDQ